MRGKFVAKHSGDGRDDALRGVVLDMLQVHSLHSADMAACSVVLDKIQVHTRKPADMAASLCVSAVHVCLLERCVLQMAALQLSASGWGGQILMYYVPCRMRNP